MSYIGKDSRCAKENLVMIGYLAWLQVFQSSVLKLSFLRFLLKIVMGALAWKITHPTNQPCKEHTESTSPPGYSSATSVCVHVSWRAYFLSASAPATWSFQVRAPHISTISKGIRQFGYAFTHTISSDSPYLLHSFPHLFIQWIFTEHQSCTRPCY